MRARARWGRVIALALVGLAVVSGSGCGGEPSDSSAEDRAETAAADCLVARRVMRVAEDVVRVQQPPPAEAARFYAYVASAYADAVTVGSQAAAVATASEIIGVLYPNRRHQAQQALAAAATPCSSPADGSSQMRKDVVAKYLRRSERDGHDLAWNGQSPRGAGMWSGNGVEPATPRAGEWMRWGVQGPFQVAAPPQYGSPVDRAEMSKVVTAVAKRNGEWVAKINFWGGTPGTDTPAGIWQNQLFSVFAPDIGTSVGDDRMYARAQAMLAQVLADAFIECWKVKYTYWTARPSERIPGLSLAMEDPPFPSYVSGHAAVSAAAAEVLSVLLPRHASKWRAMAQDAADSRLYAGIHFEVDTTEGSKLGAAVARDFVTRLRLEALTA